MCLIRVDETYDPPLGEIEAEKIFVRDPRTGRLASPYFSHQDDEPFERRYYEEGKWYDAGPEMYVLDGSRSPFYKAGFHAYADASSADFDARAMQSYFIYESLVVRKVKLRGVHTRGVDGARFGDMFKCYVAQEMLLLPESGAGEQS